MKWLALCLDERLDRYLDFEPDDFDPDDLKNDPENDFENDVRPGVERYRLLHPDQASTDERLLEYLDSIRCQPSDALDRRAPPESPDRLDLADEPLPLELER